jgi:hypothetical protein
VGVGVEVKCGARNSRLGGEVGCQFESSGKRQGRRSEVSVGLVPDGDGGGKQPSACGCGDGVGRVRRGAAEGLDRTGGNPGRRGVWRRRGLFLRVFFCHLGCKCRQPA